MARFHFYIQPFDHTKSYSGTWHDVTEDVDMSGGTLKQSLDNTEYDVGVFRNANITLKFRNDDGKYSEADTVYSIFKWKRSESKVRITWEPGDKDLVCGFFNAGDPDAIVTDETTIFEGLLSDDATKEGMNSQIINFTLLGYESIFSKVETPYSSLSVGDTFEEILYTILNQTQITDLVTVSTGNINCGNNETTENDISDLENKTVLEALKKILLPSNSVLYINTDNEVIISERTVGSTTAHTFYGPASSDGIENILKINEYRLGINRVINYWTFKKSDETTRLKQDATSVGNNGVRKKEIECKLINDNNTKIDTMLETLRDEFATKKIELIITCPYDTDTFEIFLLDKILIDYPSHALPADGLPVGIYDVSDPATDYYYAHELFNLTIDTGITWKVLERQIRIKDQTLTLKLREV